MVYIFHHSALLSLYFILTLCTRKLKRRLSSMKDVYIIKVIILCYRSFNPFKASSYFCIPSSKRSRNSSSTFKSCNTLFLFSSLFASFFICDLSFLSLSIPRFLLVYIASGFIIHESCQVHNLV